MTKSNISQYEYLIIGGTTKAATTSLYYYLADHPGVSATSLKETRFFLDENYPVQPHAAKWQDGTEKFETFFNTDESKLRVEATPDYLYSLGTAERINAELPKAKIVFILRDPITRLVSWYKYSKQRNNIPKSMTFDEYVEKQLSGKYFEQSKQVIQSHNRNEDENLSYFLSALENGRYAKFLQTYIETLGHDKVKVYFYENLCANPSELLQDLCSFASLEPSFYLNYDFKVFNRSVKIGSAKLNNLYSRTRQMIRHRTHNLPIHKLLRQLRLWFDPIYYRLNSKSAEKVQISPETRRKLEAYYEEDIQLLDSIVGSTPPWETRKVGMTVH